MAELTSRPNRIVCALCNDRCPTAHVKVMARQHDGTWITVYRTCWECGVEELRRYRAHNLPYKSEPVYALYSPEMWL